MRTKITDKTAESGVTIYYRNAFKKRQFMQKNEKKKMVKVYSAEISLESLLPPFSWY